MERANEESTLSSSLNRERMLERFRQTLLGLSKELGQSLVGETLAARPPIVLHEEGNGYVYSLVCLRAHDYWTLTSREREVTVLVQHGLDNKGIGTSLGTSPATVATHLRSIFRKLGISSRNELLVGTACVAARRPPEGEPKVNPPACPNSGHEPGCHQQRERLARQEAPDR